MRSSMIRTLVHITAATLCCALLFSGCRREAEEPAEVSGVQEHEAPQAVHIDSEYFVAYPGAEVDIAGFEQHPNYLTQTVDASSDEVIAYYTRYYKGKGWTEGPVLDRPDLHAQTFLGPEGRVTVTVRAPEGGRRLVGLVYNQSR